MEEPRSDESIRRVLFELAMTEDGSLEVYLDYEMKPITSLAVASALDMAHKELKRRIVWGGEE